MDTLKCSVVIWAVLGGVVFLPVNRNANNSKLRRRKWNFFFREHINISVGNEFAQHKNKY